MCALMGLESSRDTLIALSDTRHATLQTPQHRRPDLDARRGRDAGTRFSRQPRWRPAFVSSSYETVLKYLRTTGTSTGLKVKAYLAPNYYPTGVRISDKQMATLRIQEHDTQPKRNYTLRPA